MTNKFLINCQYGGDDLEKATVAMIVAGATSAMVGETAVFMTGESVRMATKGGADGLAIVCAAAQSILEPRGRNRPNRN